MKREVEGGVGPILIHIPKAMSLRALRLLLTMTIATCGQVLCRVGRYLRIKHWNWTLEWDRVITVQVENANGVYTNFHD